MLWLDHLIDNDTYSGRRYGRMSMVFQSRPIQGCAMIDGSEELGERND